MLVGITYDLRSDYLKEGYSEEETAEFDREDTIGFIESALAGLGHQTERIGHARSLMEKLLSGKKWDIVFNICEGLQGFAREAQVPAILDVYKIPFVFSDAVVLGISLQKAFTKRIVRDAGISTPDFFVITKAEDIQQITIPFPLFLKPLAEGTSKGVSADSVVRNSEQLERTAVELLKRFKQPVLVEKFLPGREFTVAIVGTGNKARALGAMEVMLNEKAEQDVYSYHNKENYKNLVSYRLVDDETGQQCMELGLKVWNILGCCDAGRLDVRLDENGKPGFIEINPLAGMHPIHSDLPIIASKRGISYQELIGLIMESAIERNNIYGK